MGRSQNNLFFVSLKYHQHLTFCEEKTRLPERCTAPILVPVSFSIEGPGDDFLLHKRIQGKDETTGGKASGPEKMRHSQRKV